MTLFDPAEGTRRREASIKQVAVNVRPDWAKEAQSAVVRVALRECRFTTDDVWQELDGVDATIEPRALGAVMRRCEGLGYIAACDDWRLSKRPECHRRPLRVWRSKLK